MIQWKRSRSHHEWQDFEDGSKSKQTCVYSHMPYERTSMIPLDVSYKYIYTLATLIILLTVVSTFPKITGIVCRYCFAPSTNERRNPIITFSNSPLPIGSSTSAAQRDQKPTVAGRVASLLSARHGVRGEEEVGGDRLERIVEEPRGDWACIDWEVVH